jgi:hypothetical protein
MPGRRLWSYENRGWLEFFPHALGNSLFQQVQELLFCELCRPDN